MGRVVHFEIHASDMDAAERFYTAAFGWTAQRTPSADRDYRLLVTGADGTPGINGALLERRGEAPAPGEPVSAFVCTVAVDDLDETDRRITDQGGARWWRRARSKASDASPTSAIPTATSSG